MLTSIAESQAADHVRWQTIVARYAKPDLARSLWQVANTLIPYFVLWGLMIWSVPISYWVTLGLSVIAAGFLMRTFIILRFIVVFDGSDVHGRDARADPVEVRYSKPPAKADDLIRSLVQHHVEREESLTVVTSDLEVARHARAMGADVSLSDLFLASLLGPAPAAGTEKPVSLSKKEIEEWAEIFRRGRVSGEAPPEEDDGGRTVDGDEPDE